MVERVIIHLNLLLNTGHLEIEIEIEIEIMIKTEREIRQEKETLRLQPNIHSEITPINLTDLIDLNYPVPAKMRVRDQRINQVVPK